MSGRTRREPDAGGPFPPASPREPYLRSAGWPTPGRYRSDGFGEIHRRGGGAGGRDAPADARSSQLANEARRSARRAAAYDLDDRGGDLRSHRLGRYGPSPELTGPWRGRDVRRASGYDHSAPYDAGSNPLSAFRGRRRGYDARLRYQSEFAPLDPREPLARELRREAEALILDYLRSEPYGAEYARTMGMSTRGRGDRLRRIARRITDRRYRPPR